MVQSSNVRAERTLRLIIKLTQLLASLYLIIAMYNIGPHWILLVASLAIPLYGLFLIFRSPERTLRQHPLPYVRYKALARARSWLRVDVAICATMAFVCLAFALVLLLGYFQEHSVNTFLLQAAIAALLLALLYSLNCLLSIRQLQMGQVDFLLEKQNASISTTRASTQTPIGEQNYAERPESPINGHSSPYRISNEFQENWRQMEKPMVTSSALIQSPTSSIERQGSSLLEQLQTELAAEYAYGRWRHIPIEVESAEERMESKQKVERKVIMEQRRSDKFGMDLGEFGTKKAKWMDKTIDEGKRGQKHDKMMLPRLAVQKNGGNSRIRGEWSGTVSQRKDQLENASPTVATTSSFSPSSGENGIGGQPKEIRRTIEKKRVRYETIASKTLVDIDKGKELAEKETTTIIGGQLRPRRDFDVSICPRTSPFRHSTELRLRDDLKTRTSILPHQITEL